MTNLLGKMVTLPMSTDASTQYEIVAVHGHEGWVSSNPNIGGYNVNVSWGAVSYVQFSFLVKAPDGSLLVFASNACKLVD